MAAHGIIEGISNDALVVSGVMLCALIWGLLTVCNRFITGRSAISPIHPDSQEAVTNARERLTARPPRESNSQILGCPVCLGDVQYGLETNCGHTFCGQCIITYWQSGRWTGPVRCPLCRQTVTVLMSSFTREELQQQNSEEKDGVIGSARSYNRRFSGEPRTVIEYIRDLPAVLRHAISDLFTLEGMVAMFRLRVVVCFFLAFVYILSPFDLIPEMVMGVLGFVDDLFIMVILAIYISMIYRAFLAERATATPTHAHTD